MAKRIMTVDDSATMRTMLNLTLTHAGYEVVEACDGDEALALLAAGSVDLLVTDLNMPNMNGIALAGAARKIPGSRFMPIIMLSSEREGSKKADARSAGVSAWLTKPFKAPQLVGLVKMVLF